MMEDIELASSLLEEEKLNLVIVKEGQVLFKSKEGGLRPVFFAVRNATYTLHNASAADRIVGLAAAMLYLHAGVVSVYAYIVSAPALALLKEKGVAIASKNVVPNIYNHDGTDVCPFEKLAQSVTSSVQLISDLESFFIGVDR